MQKESEAEVVRHYVSLRNLLLSDQTDAARSYFKEKGLISNWRMLLHYAGTQKNCHVCALIIDHVYELGNFSDQEFPLEITKAVHGIHVDFYKRIKVYINSGKFDTKLEQYYELNKAIQNAVHGTGHDFVNLKPHHFQSITKTA